MVGRACLDRATGHPLGTTNRSIASGEYREQVPGRWPGRDGVWLFREVVKAVAGDQACSRCGGDVVPSVPLSAPCVPTGNATRRASPVRQLPSLNRLRPLGDSWPDRRAVGHVDKPGASNRPGVADQPISPSRPEWRREFRGTSIVSPATRLRSTSRPVPRRAPRHLPEAVPDGIPRC